MGIKPEQRSVLDDLPELSGCDGRGYGIGAALRQDGEAMGAFLLEAQLLCLHKLCLLCSDRGKDPSLDMVGDISQTDFQHAGKKHSKRGQFRAAFLSS